MILIIFLLSFVSTFLIQDRYFKNKKNYKNKSIQVYQNVKIPIFVSCVVTLNYIILSEKKPEISPDIFMKEPCF
jgi:uncharacterized Fe-S cluster protein YjdI